jgi:hypothetical protein
LTRCPAMGRLGLSVRARLAAVMAGDRGAMGRFPKSSQEGPGRESWRDGGIVNGEIAVSYRGCPPVVDCRVGERFGGRAG